MKYMVMECHEGYAVLMDEESRFVQAANLRYKVGQTVTDPFLMNAVDTSHGKISMHISKFVAAAACFTLAVSAGALYYSRNYKAHSTVVISSETNVRMELNKKGKVLTIRTENPSSDTIIENYDGKGKDMLTAANDIIDMEKDKGYIDSGDTVDIYIKADNSADYYSYKSDLITGIPDVKVKVQEFDALQKEAPAPHDPPKTDPAREAKKPDPPKPPHEDAVPEPPKPADATPPAPAAPPAANNNTAPHAKQPDAPAAPAVPEPPKPDGGAAPKPGAKPKVAEPHKTAAPLAAEVEKSALNAIKNSSINPYNALHPHPEAVALAEDKNKGPAREALPGAEKAPAPPISKPLSNPLP